MGELIGLVKDAAGSGPVVAGIVGLIWLAIRIARRKEVGGKIRALGVSIGVKISAWLLTVLTLGIAQWVEESFIVTIISWARDLLDGILEGILKDNQKKLLKKRLKGKK